jgi:signal transduction histidine kinase/FixJ family two-component response regulator
MGFLVAILSTVAITMTGYYGDRRLSNNTRWVDRTHRVIETIASVRSGLKEIQERQLRFVLTGDETYLSDFARDSAALKARLASLRELTKNNRSQQRRADLLNRLVTTRLALTARIRTVRRTEGLSAAGILINSQGSAISLPAFDIISSMMKDEEVLLARRSSRARSNSDFNTAVSFGGCVFTVTWLGFAGFLIRRTFTKLDNSRVSLSELNQHLELRVAERSAALQSQTNMVQSILESMTESLVVVDRDQQLRQFNPAALRILGGEANFQHSGNEPWRKAFKAYRGNEIEPLAPEEMPITLALAGRDSDAVELRIVDAVSGRQTWIEASARPIRAADGSVPFAVFAFHDVTARKQADAEMRRARDLAIESARRRSEFLSTMSHEIRTPLNGILGTTQLLLSSELNPEQRESAETLFSSATMLLGTVNDILDFSKLTEGKVELEKIGFDLMNVLKATRDKFLEPARHKGIELLLKIDHHLPKHLLGDYTKLRQVLDHLVGNAVKFTRQGEVVIRARKTHEDDQFASIRIDIRDTGIGIAPEITRKLFQPFSQADRFNSRKHDGTGLGLVISEQLIELMGGNIALSSQPDVGSTFHFTIDFEKPPSSRAEVNVGRGRAEADPPHRKIRVLVIDSTLVDRLVAATQLKKLGYLSDTVGSGEQALRSLAKTNYDVVLMECEMPMNDSAESADTFQIVHAIREQDGDARHTTVIAMTARDLEGVRDRCADAGIDDYLSKPVKLQVLSALVERWTSPDNSAFARSVGKPGPFTAARACALLHRSAPVVQIVAATKGRVNI